MNVAEQKQAVARAAMDWLDGRLAADRVVGVGTGTTADLFIDLLAQRREAFRGAVASSSRSADRLAAQGVRVFDLNDVERLPWYVDGADEVNGALALTKGGGGALTREKIVAAASDVFVCICDETKRVEALGRFPLPVEVIPMARAQVARALKALGDAHGLGDAAIALRTTKDGATLVTDNGNVILDVAGWSIADPVVIEEAIGRIVGVVESGLFAARGADLLLVATAEGVVAQERPSMRKG